MISNRKDVACKIFTNSRDWRIRVVYDDAGAPLYCSQDVARSMGYEIPGKAVARAMVAKEHALVPWENGRRSGATDSYCFRETAMVQFIEGSVIKKPAGFVQWINDEVIPGARRGPAPVERVIVPPQKRSAPALPAPVVTTQAAAPTVNVSQRIDEIILELMLLKKSLG